MAGGCLETGGGWVGGGLGLPDDFGTAGPIASLLALKC